MKDALFVTDCEGPISKNDNAFELTSEFISDGERLFTQLSRYDDVQAEIIRREGYNAGDTLRLIVPFLKAHGITNRSIAEFSAKSLLVMHGAKETLQLLQKHMPSFIVSTSYEQYIQVLCEALEFPFENAYYTKLNIDSFPMNHSEKEKIQQLMQEICAMPLIEIPPAATSLIHLSEQSRQSVRRINEILWHEIPAMRLGSKFRQLNPMGGAQKAEAVTTIASNMGRSLGQVIYTGDSITDVACMRLVRKRQGIAVSFNGNAYAINNAEVAILSQTSLPIAILALTFNTLGRDAMLRLVQEMEQEGFQQTVQETQLGSNLKRRVEELPSTHLPQVHLITRENKDEIIDQSSTFRKRVRGMKIGTLG